jgi:hypothetical protein
MLIVRGEATEEQLAAAGFTARLDGSVQRVTLFETKDPAVGLSAGF